MQDVSRVKGGVIYGDKDPNLYTVKRFISCQRGGFGDARKLKTMFTKYN